MRTPLQAATRRWEGGRRGGASGVCGRLRRGSDGGAAGGAAMEKGVWEGLPPPDTFAGQREDGTRRQPVLSGAAPVRAAPASNILRMTHAPCLGHGDVSACGSWGREPWATARGRGAGHCGTVQPGVAARRDLEKCAISRNARLTAALFSMPLTAPGRALLHAGRRRVPRQMRQMQMPGRVREQCVTSHRSWHNRAKRASTSTTDRAADVKAECPGAHCRHASSLQRLVAW